MVVGGTFRIFSVPKLGMPALNLSTLQEYAENYDALVNMKMEIVLVGPRHPVLSQRLGRN